MRDSSSELEGARSGRSKGNFDVSEDQDRDDPPPPASGGIYLSRGMQLQIPAGGFTISVGGDGQADMRVTAVKLCLGLHVRWLEIALKHLEDAERAHADLLDGWPAGDDELKGQTLENEFASSLQSVVAAAVAVDAFYAMIRRYIAVPEDTMKAWRKNRTSRPRQITEVFRLSFAVGTKSTAEMGGRLKDPFKLRDRSVHPTAEFECPVWYEELGVLTEWRFVAFRAENAKSAVSLVLSIIAQLFARPRSTSLELAEHCKGAVQFITPLVEEWERKYGELYTRA